jgi:hypothetical protein
MNGVYGHYNLFREVHPVLWDPYWKFELHGFNMIAAPSPVLNSSKSVLSKRNGVRTKAEIYHHWFFLTEFFFPLPSPWLGIFLFTTVSRTALGPTQPPIQWIPRALSLGKLTTHLLLVPRSKNVWIYTSTPPIRLHGVMLSSAQEQIYLYLYLPFPFSFCPLLIPWSHIFQLFPNLKTHHTYCECF